MKPRLLELLACPECLGPLDLSDSRRNGGEILAGTLACAGCGAAWPIRDAIPRFVANDAYVDSFSFEWNVFRKVQIDILNETSLSEEDFTRKTGFTAAEVRGKTILDAGVGAGRYAEVVSRWGGEVVGFDLSYAVDAAFRNIGGRENVHLVQADVFRPPFRRGIFNHAYSLGVLHHSPDTHAAFAAVSQMVRPGGALAVYVYPRGTYHMFSDIWRKVTVHLPLRAAWLLSLVAAPLYYLYRIPLLGRLIRPLFPISMEPRWRWRWLDTFDWYTPRYQGKHTWPEVFSWFRENGFRDVELYEPPICMRGFKRP